jgi:hypothetical protein
MNFELILALSAITVLAVESKPTNWIYYQLTKGLDIKWSLQIMDFLRCPLCLGFWIGLIFTFSVPQAAIVSVLAQFIQNQIMTGKL